MKIMLDKLYRVYHLTVSIRRYIIFLTISSRIYRIHNVSNTWVFAFAKCLRLLHIKRMKTRLISFIIYGKFIFSSLIYTMFRAKAL